MYAITFEADIVSEYLRIPNFEQLKNKHVRVVIETDESQSVQVVNECHFVLSRKFGFDEGAVTNAIESGILGIATRYKESDPFYMLLRLNNTM